MSLLSPRRFFILTMNETLFAEPTIEIPEDTQEPINHEEGERFEHAPEGYDTEPTPRDETAKEERTEAAETEDPTAQRKAIVMERYSGDESDWKCTYKESGHRIDLETNQLIDAQGKSLTKEIESSNINMSAEKIAEHHRMLDHFRSNPDEPYPLPDWIEKTKDGDEIIHVTVAYATKSGPGDKFVDISYETWSHNVEKAAVEKEEETEELTQEEQMVDPDITIIDLGAAFVATAGENIPVAEYGVDAGKNIDAITKGEITSAPDAVAVIPASRKIIADNISVGAEEVPDKIESNIAASEGATEATAKSEHLPAEEEAQSIGQPEAAMAAEAEEDRRIMTREQEAASEAMPIAKIVHEPLAADAAAVVTPRLEGIAASNVPHEAIADMDIHRKESSSEIKNEMETNEVVATIAEKQASDGITERNIERAETITLKTTSTETKNEGQNQNTEIKIMPKAEVVQARQAEVVAPDRAEGTIATAFEKAAPTAREIVSTSEASFIPTIITTTEIAERTTDTNEMTQAQVSREARHERDVAIPADHETSPNESAPKKEHDDTTTPRPMTGRQILWRSLGIPLQREAPGESALLFGTPIASGISAQDTTINQSSAPQRGHGNRNYLNGITLRRAA